MLKEEDVLEAKPCRLAPETCIVEDMEGMYTSQTGQCLLQPVWFLALGGSQTGNPSPVEGWGWEVMVVGSELVADRHRGPSAPLRALIFLGSFGELAFGRPLTTAKVC